MAAQGSRLLSQLLKINAAGVPRSQAMRAFASILPALLCAAMAYSGLRGQTLGAHDGDHSQKDVSDQLEQASSSITSLLDGFEAKVKTEVESKIKEADTPRSHDGLPPFTQAFVPEAPHYR